MPRTYYAAYRPYGVTALNTNGAQRDILLWYPTQEERDAEIDTDPTHYEAIPARSLEVRRARRHESLYGYQVIVRGGPESEQD